MNSRISFTGLLVLTAWCSAATAASTAEAVKAGDRCESAVAETVRRMRGREAQEVQFVGAKRVLTPTNDEEETEVKGEGRYRGNSVSAGVMAFTYSCAFNSKSGATSGVVFRETGTRGDAGAAWEPDLSKVTPEDCETAAASLLKQKYPRVGRIAFGSDSRQLRPAPNAHTTLEGEGALQRAPGMNSTPFRYRCEFDTASGKVLSVQAND